MVTTKICFKCKKESSDFSPSRYNKDGLKSYCRPCNRIKSRERWKKASQDQKNRCRINRWKNRGVLDIDGSVFTVEKYNRLYQIQGGRCGICERHVTEVKDQLCIDHDHATRKVRGLLCHSCNKGLGHFMDNKDLLEKANSYLGRF